MRLVALAALAGTTGCAALDTTAPGGARAALHVHAWTLPQCPSEPARPASATLAPLVGAAVDLVLDQLAGALASAAAADRDGVAWSGADARYLYFGRAVAGTGGTPVPSLAGCIVVALTDRAGTRPADWCAAHDGAPSLSPAFDAPCAPEGRKLLAAADRDTPRTASTIGHSLPRLYAEVRLLPSRDGAAIAPEILNLHYPQPLKARRAATRDLALTLQLRLPEQAKGANLFVLLRDLTPGKPHYDPATDFAGHDTLWTAAPVYVGRKLTPADAGEGMGPVNITTQIRETGDANAFLQALADAFGDFRPRVTNALK